MPRLFTGIALPENIRQDLARLAEPMPGVRWLDSQNMHITLRFAGDIDNGLAREFADLLAAIDIRAFEIRLAGLGVFGGKEPRVIWAGVDTCPELEALARANERAARAAGLSAETRVFKPHVTLARLKFTRHDVLARFLERQSRFQTAPFFVGQFELYSSRPQTGGGPYVSEESFALAGGGLNFSDADALEPDRRW